MNSQNENTAKPDVQHNEAFIAQTVQRLNALKEESQPCNVPRGQRSPTVCFGLLGVKGSTMVKYNVTMDVFESQSVVGPNGALGLMGLLSSGDAARELATAVSTRLICNTEEQMAALHKGN